MSLSTLTSMFRLVHEISFTNMAQAPYQSLLHTIEVTKPLKGR